MRDLFIALYGIVKVTVEELKAFLPLSFINRDVMAFANAVLIYCDNSLKIVVCVQDILFRLILI